MRVCKYIYFLHRLLADDPHQLFTRVNQLSQELCIELKVRLLSTIYDAPNRDEACAFIQGMISFFIDIAFVILLLPYFYDNDDYWTDIVGETLL